MTESCCNAMAEVLAKYDLPFEYPIKFRVATGEMTADTLCARLSKKTASGNLSRKGGAWLVVNFCPICGNQLQEFEKAEAETAADVRRE